MLVPWAGRTFATLDAEGKGSVTGYEAGTFNSQTGEFTVATPASIADATHIRSITLALRNGGLPASDEASQHIVIEDLSGRQLRDELHIGTGDSAPLATAFTTEYNDAPANAISTITRYHDGHIIEETTEVSPFCTVRIDEQGIKNTTVRDAIGRTTSVTVEGIAANGDFGAQAARVTSITYAGRSSTTESIGGNLSLFTSRTEDQIGRVISETDETGAVMVTSYPNGGRDTQTNFPGDNTRLSTNTIDGLPVSVTGLAVVNEAWAYSLDGDNLMTAHTVGGTGSTRTITTVTDPAGRVISTSAPSPVADHESTVTETTCYAVNTHRVESRSSDSGAATLLMTRPAVNSSQVLSGYDLNNDGELLSLGTDRITSIRSYYVNDNGAWWQVTERKVFDSATTAVTTSTRERLSGNTGNIASAVREILPGGGTILTETALNRNSKSRIQTVTRSGYVQPEIMVDINGLGMAHWAPDATKPTRRTFDALGRIVTETTPEGAITTTTWGTDGKISSVADHFGNTTTYTWCGPTTASAGRPDTETNPAGKTTIRTWSKRGELLTVSGTAQDPVSYTYDDYGDRLTMTTWRDVNNAGTTSATTTWHHDAASGVLLEKIYQGGNKTAYTWYATGKPHTHTWQRGAVTTWAWNTCGDLTGITYTGDNDLTPDVSITALDCLGRPLTVTQAGIGT